MTTSPCQLLLGFGRLVSCAEGPSWIAPLTSMGTQDQQTGPRSSPFLQPVTRPL